MWLNPELPSCHDCQKWIHDDQWRTTKRAGKPIPRPPNARPPCWKCPKSEDKKSPCPDAELSDRSLMTLQVYYQIKAGMPMPRDSVVAWYCGVIRWLEEQIDRGRLESAAALPLALLASTVGKAGAVKLR